MKRRWIAAALLVSLGACGGGESTNERGVRLQMEACERITDEALRVKCLNAIDHWGG